MSIKSEIEKLGGKVVICKGSSKRVGEYRAEQVRNLTEYPEIQKMVNGELQNTAYLAALTVARRNDKIAAGETVSTRKSTLVEIDENETE